MLVESRHDDLEEPLVLGDAHGTTRREDELFNLLFQVDGQFASCVQVSKASANACRQGREP